MAKYRINTGMGSIRNEMSKRSTSTILRRYHMMNSYGKIAARDELKKRGQFKKLGIKKRKTRRSSSGYDFLGGNWGW